MHPHSSAPHAILINAGAQGMQCSLWYLLTLTADAAHVERCAREGEDAQHHVLTAHVYPILIPR